MNRNIKLILCCILLCFTTILVSACGPSDFSEDTPESEAINPTNHVTYRMWTYNNDENSRAQVAYATAAVKKIMPDITVDVEAIDTTDTAMTKFKVYIAANDVPQFFKAKKANVDLCIATGQIADLTGLATKTLFNDRITGMGLQIATYKDKLYSFPDLALSCAMIYYNKGIFKKNGVLAPVTYKDFLTAVKVFRAKGITPISIAGKDKWFYAMLLDIFATRYDPISSTNILNKKLKFTDPPYLQAAAKIQELAKAGAFSKDVNLQDYAAADSAFQAGMSAMIVNGSWAFSTYDNKLKDDFGYLYFPVDDVTQADASRVHWAGGDVSPAGMSINPKKFKSQAELDRAVQFLFNWAQASCDYYGEKGNPITSMKTDKHPAVGFSANMQQWIKDFNAIQTSTPYVQAMLPNGAKTAPEFTDLLQKLSTGQYDSSEFCADAQNITDDN